MKDKRKVIILGAIIAVLVIIIGLAIWYVLKDDVVQEVIQRQEYEVGEKESQTNDYNDPEKWLTYEEYKAINDDVIGMIEFEDRRLPVVQAADNDQYLHTNIYGDEDIFGVPFLDANIDLETTQNLIIHAHSTYNKDLLFTFFKDYVNDPEWGKDHRNFYYTDDEGTHEYEIIVATKIDANSEGKDLYWYKWDWADNLEKTAYISNMINYGDVYYSTSYNYLGDIITLVTCNMDNTDERYILTCSYIGEVQENEQ